MLQPARFATLLLIVVALVATAFSLKDKPRAGSLAATLAAAPHASDGSFVVTSVRPESRLHVGDRVLVPDPRALAAYRYHDLASGSALAVRRIAPGPATSLAEPVLSNRTSFFREFSAFDIAYVAMFLAVATIIALRGTSAGALSLATFFGLIPLMANTTTPAWPTTAIFAYAVSQGSIVVLGFLFAIDFATKFTNRPDDWWAVRFRLLARYGGAVALVLCTAIPFASYVAPESPPIFETLIDVAFIAPIVAFVVALVLAYVRASAGERDRAAWVVVSLGVGVCAFLASFLEGMAGIEEPWRDAPLLLLALMPLGCAYAILRYRLLDIGFAVNRATVFGITSLVVLGALALIEDGLQSFLGTWLVRNGTYVQLALALGIGIATRPLNARVDAIVDDVFFRRRNETIRALETFARDVAFIDDPTLVVERSTNAVAQTAGLRCDAFLASANGFAAATGESASAATVERNDPGIVRMLATRAAVDVRDVTSAVAADYAFPMFARNRLLGFLACATLGDESLAPDEMEAIAAVARAAGLTLDLLRIETLEREVARLSTATPGRA